MPVQSLPKVSKNDTRKTSELFYLVIQNSLNLNPKLLNPSSPASSLGWLNKCVEDYICQLVPSQCRSYLAKKIFLLLYLIIIIYI